MKMIGVIKEINKEKEYGYILGSDDELYLFYFNTVNDIENLKVNRVVKFNPIFEKNNLAIEIEIINEI